MLVQQSHKQTKNIAPTSCVCMGGEHMNTNLKLQQQKSAPSTPQDVAPDSNSSSAFSAQFEPVRPSLASNATSEARLYNSAGQTHTDITAAASGKGVTHGRNTDTSKATHQVKGSSPRRTAASRTHKGCNTYQRGPYPSGTRDHLPRKWQRPSR